MYFSPNSFRQEIDEISSVRASLSGEAYLASRQKRLVDLYGALALRCAAEPIMLAARAAVRAEDGGSTLIDLPRIGMHGDEFMQYKIRTMTAGTKHLPVAIRPKRLNDDRVTRVGRVFRAWSVDELPQLRNIQEGSMSLVGPRPMPRTQFDAFGEIDDVFQQAYTAGRPGLTGLEQIGGRGEATNEQRIAYTKQYASEASLALDADILAKTIGTVLRRDGAC